MWATTSNPVTSFGCTLVNEMFINAKGNVVLSPYSLWVALSMSEGATAESSVAMAELRKLLQYDCIECGNVDDWYAKARAAMATDDPKVILKIANAIFASGDVKPEFVQKCKSTFMSDVKPLKKRKGINDFVANNTDNIIRDLLSEDPAGPAVLVNAVNFKASWTEEFDTGNTTGSRFTPFSGVSMPCKMMNLHANNLGYYKIKHVQMVKLDYGDNNEFAAFIALPAVKGQDSMNSAVQQLFASAAQWDIATADMRPQEVNLFLPRFTVEGGVDGLKGYMEKKGVSAVFNAGGMLGLTGSPSDYIGDIVHKSSISVDEQGAIATGATAVVVTRSISRAPIVEVDRPFVFAVVHKKTNTLLFAACVNSV